MTTVDHRQRSIRDSPARQAAMRLAAPAIGAWAAAASCTLLSPAQSLLVAVVAGLAATVAALSRRPARQAQRLATLVALGVVIAALSASFHVHDLRAGPVPRLALARADVEVVARLVRDPVAVTTIAGSHLTLVDATVTSVLADGWHHANSPVLVLSYGAGWTGLLPGQRVELSGRLSPPRHGDDVSAVLDARGPPFAMGRPPWWQRLAGRVRARLRQACRGLPADERGLLPGLVDGDVSSVPASMHADLQVTGLTHLEAVSGENVSVVLGVTIAVASSLGLRRRSRVVVAAVALLGFVVLARPSASVLRAAVMGGIVLLGLATGRRAPALPALSAAVLVLVVVDPFLARSLGFVLSVFATAALLTIAPSWTERLARHLPRGLAAMIAVPAAAQLACTPVLLLAFGQLTPYAVPANLLAAPAVAPATILGVVCAGMAAVAPGLGVPIAWLAALPTAAIAVVARSIAQLPAAGVTWPGGLVGTLTAVAAGLVTTAMIVIGLHRRRGHHEILGQWQR